MQTTNDFDWLEKIESLSPEEIEAMYPTPGTITEVKRKRKGTIAIVAASMLIGMCSIPLAQHLIPRATIETAAIEETAAEAAGADPYDMAPAIAKFGSPSENAMKGFERGQAIARDNAIADVLFQVSESDTTVTYTDPWVKIVYTDGEVETMQFGHSVDDGPQSIAPGTVRRMMPEHGYLDTHTQQQINRAEAFFEFAKMKPSYHH